MLTNHDIGAQLISEVDRLERKSRKPCSLLVFRQPNPNDGANSGVQFVTSGCGRVQDSVYSCFTPSSASAERWIWKDQGRDARRIFGGVFDGDARPREREHERRALDVKVAADRVEIAQVRFERDILDATRREAGVARVVADDGRHFRKLLVGRGGRRPGELHLEVRR